MLQQLNRINAIADKNERLNKQLGALQRGLEAVEKDNLALEKRLEENSSAHEGSAEKDGKLERILEQLESQNQQIHALVDENKNMSAKLAEATAKIKSGARKATSRSKAQAIPEGCDDLTEINGVGPKSREQLYKAGVKTFQEIAAWSKQDIDSYADKLSCKSNRIEKWVSEAKKLS